MSSFDGVAFKVLGDGGQLPTIVKDGDGVKRYTASVRIASSSVKDALAAKQSIVTPLRVYGTTTAALHVEGGFGAASLIVPTRAGATATSSALLVSLTNIRADGRGAASGANVGFVADAEWIVV